MFEQFTPEQAADQLLRRRRLRSNMGDWALLNGFMPARHHRLLIDHLEALARGDIERLAVFMPPGSAKSTYGSILFPSWLLSKNPKAMILAASHTTELAERWGRRVRNLIGEHAEELRVKLLTDNQAAGRWGLEQGGEYLAAGAGTGIAGFRALFGLIDDPIRSRQDADSQLVRDRLWDWYLNDFRPRLIPNARQLLIQCMTGDTSISMADGRLKRLDAIRLGDLVVSWNGTRIVGSEVSAIVDNGIDQTYLIRTSGAEVRANARHPFLVLSDGGLRWVRTRDLRRGMRIVTQNTARTKELTVLSLGAQCPQNVVGCATAITTRRGGPLGSGHPLAPRSSGWRTVASGVTALMQKLLIDFYPNRMVFAPYVGRMGLLEDPDTGLPTSYPIITTKQGSFAASYVTTATGLPDEPEIPKFWNVPSNTSEPVIDVIPYGRERVYDLTIANTHNYNANGYWTSNTRWHEDDLAGRALNLQPWNVLSLPALAKSDDALGRSIDEPLWTDDDYGYGAQLLTMRETTPPRVWSALYQQAPAPDEGDFFKEEWLKPVDIIPSHVNLRVYGGSDYAVTMDGGDYTVHAVIGIDHLNNMYLLDIWRGQKSSDVWIEAFCDLVEKYRPLEWAEEQGQIKSGVGPFLEKRMRERRVYVNRTGFPVRGDKAVRARSIQGRMALDGLFYKKNAVYIADFLAELLAFPASQHDDQCDALGLVGQLLDVMVSGRAQKPSVMKLPKDGYKRPDLKTVDHMTL